MTTMLATRQPDGTPAEESAGGHAVTAGSVLIGMGFVGILGAWVFHGLLGIEMGFISAEGMRNIGLINLGLGIWMVVTGFRDRS